MRIQEADKFDISVFHRTKSFGNPEDTIKSFISGFTPGLGLYGVGLYAADWNTQIKYAGTMEGTYGDLIIQYKANIKGYLIFDYRLAKYFYGADYSLEDQLLALKVFTAQSMPQFIKSLSNILQKSFSDPLVSSQQAQPFSRGLMNKPSVSDSKFPTAVINVINSNIKNGRIKGLAFSGEHDGHVVFTFASSISKLIYVGWCRTEKGKMITPWSYSKELITAGGVADAYQRKINAVIDKLKQGNSIESIASVSSFKSVTEANAVAERDVEVIKGLLSPLARFKNLSISVDCLNNKFTIKTGSWLSGDTPENCFVGGKVNFIGGTFRGIEFYGEFNGGMFEKGKFMGSFNGGIFVISKDTYWGSNSKLTTNKASIKVNGKVYPWKQGKTPEEAWKFINTEGTHSLTKNEFIDRVKSRLPYDCEELVVADDIIDSCLKKENPIIEFKKRYPEIFREARWKTNQSIKITVGLSGKGKKIELVDGNLLAGTLNFDIYGRYVCINGGRIEGDNEFYGTLYSGVYNAGEFNGGFFGGTFNLDSARLGAKAFSFADGIKGADKPGYNFSVIYKGNLYKVPIELLKFRDSGKLPYLDIRNVCKDIAAGKWADMIKNAKLYALGLTNKNSNSQATTSVKASGPSNVTDDWDIVGADPKAFNKFKSIESSPAKSTSLLKILLESCEEQEFKPKTFLINEMFKPYLK